MEYSSEEKTLAGVAHIASIFSWFWIGVIVNVVLMVIYREKSKFVYQHAKQGLGLAAINVIIGLLLGIVAGGAVGASILSVGALGAAAGALMVISLISWAKLIVVLIFGILGAVKGFNGQEYRHPLFGEMVHKIGEKAA